ncbi:MULTISPECIES: hypothetical protein [unclassified Clostridium]|uniref:hypothetical protein n=1 Tax=unclassified Clostridium TaxID=2614128 RepID=UPI00321808D6
MSKEEKKLERWKRIKNKGIIAYLLKIGIFYDGLFFFLIWTFLVPFIDGDLTFNFIGNEIFKTRIIVFAIISPLFGILMAYIRYKGFEKKYEQDKF